MFTRLKIYSGCVCTLYCCSLPAEITSQELVTPITESFPAQHIGSLNPEALPIQPAEITPTKKIKVKGPFKSFTGKVKGKKVRMRLQPDVDSPIVKELTKGDLLTVIDEHEDFYVIEAPSDLKAYVFRSFVLDNHIEGTRVNVRLHPNLEAPIVAHLNSGDSVNGHICKENNKWIELPIPSSSRFYVAKDYIENCGGIEIKTHYENRLKQARQQLETAEYFVESEMKKEYPNIDFDKVNHNFQSLIEEYTEFSDLVDQAKSKLASAQEQYLDKRIAHLKTKALEETVLVETPRPIEEIVSIGAIEKPKVWEIAEEKCYQEWLNSGKIGTLDDYYEDQKFSAIKISGTLEPYKAPVKCKPADYILRENDIPVAYVYSTMINLEGLIGQKVTLIGVTRPNNNFAFPAYFVLSVESE